MHGGTVEAHSAGRGQGSEFVVRLPATPSANTAVPSVASASVESTVTPIRILAVDDNVDAATSLAMFFRILGHQVLLAHDGQEAVEIALQYRPEVVLLDIGLPRLNGYEVCRALRQQGLTSELIVAITGYGQESDRQLTAEAGFDLHLVKPVSLPGLQELLANCPVKS